MTAIKDTIIEQQDTGVDTYGAKTDMLEMFWNKITWEQERKLQDYFVNTLEYGGRGITKDNCDDLFENWAETLTLEEITKILQ